MKIKNTEPQFQEVRKLFLQILNENGFPYGGRQFAKFCHAHNLKKSRAYNECFGRWYVDLDRVNKHVKLLDPTREIIVVGNEIKINLIK